ncbi:hypothetical protein SUGI_0388600 [Cryptomeria japonica]|nr:hypothetical protein SUGI_0388600 [Cryptomeria japonica]
MIFPLVICDFPWPVCNNASTYTNLSTYSQNLNTVINDLSQNAVEGFRKSSSGQSPDTVYGLLQCFGNASAEKCSNCSRQAYSVALRNWGNDKGVRVWMDNCFLRYDNTNFSSALDTTFELLENGQNISSNVQGFISTTSGLLLNLSGEATNNLFAVGTAYFTSDQVYGFEVVYGLAQCWTDLSIKDCTTCLSQARQELEECCSSQQGARAMSGSCIVRYEKNAFFTPLLDLSSPSPSSPQTSTEKSSKSLPLILGLVGGMIMALLICLIAMRKRLKSAIFGGTVTRNEDMHGFSPEIGLLQQDQQFFFSLEELAEATENFHENKKLGEGGFGVVYKGRTKDGKEIAVKKLSAKSTQGNEQFMNEVKLVANVQHRNLVKLLGCCTEGDERLIVYEYFPNKSLDTFLFDPETCRLLDWQKRYNIIIGIARGLLYLHEDSQMRIIHRDIKANNILLDDKLNPKIADFGLAKLFPDGETHMQTRVAGTYGSDYMTPEYGMQGQLQSIQTRIAGTYGYMAPEYAMRGRLSVKADVYSFGVLLLEIVSGKKNTDHIHILKGTQTLVEWAWRLYKGGNTPEMVDPTISEECPQEQALRCIHVGLVCVQADAKLRPLMSDITVMISNSSIALPIPAEPAFLTRSRSLASTSRSKSRSGTTTSSTSGIFTVNETSVTETNPR